MNQLSLLYKKAKIFVKGKIKNDWDADERGFSGGNQFKSPLTPKRGKGQMILRIPMNCLSSL
jgi:hypothetical protein